MSAFDEFKAYWAVAEEMIAKAIKEQVAEVARVLALQAAAYTRKFGDLPLEDPLAYLKATNADAARFMVGENGGKMVGVLGDGARACRRILGGHGRYRAGSPQADALRETRGHARRRP